MRCVRTGAVQPVSRAAASEPRRALGFLFGEIGGGRVFVMEAGAVEIAFVWRGPVAAREGNRYL